ncbi:MAG: Coenzyme F420 hydrogenase/dehydrogenase, beta subunit C-terminal domain [Candidatus Coprovivens sp.]
MEKIIEKNKCTGCSACMNICPKKAITMKKDKEGFLHPEINQEKCINCGLCKKTCPVLNTKTNPSINKCYVAYNKDSKVKENSSSGGIFDSIARVVLKDKGLVIGAAFNKDNKLNHIIIEKEKDLDKVKGSKYLQSDLNNVFTTIKENIDDRIVLFVGTPCQVAGLKAYLKKDYENLICIDLFCHGVPSPKLFDKYVNELEERHNDKLLNYIFRDKSTGWDNYSNKATFKNKEYKELQKDNNYMKLFLLDIALRESCYDCNFKLGNKYSDITLGDFWGVNNYYPEMYNKKGVSAIIINTNKGLDIFNKISSNLEYKNCKLEEILSGNPSLKLSGKYPTRRNEFFDNIDTLNINALTKKYTKRPLYKRILGKLKRVIKKVLGK